MVESTMMVVGNTFPPFKHLSEAVYAEIDGSGLFLCYNFNSPTIKEIKAVSQDSTFEIRYTILENVLFFVIKCGDMNWSDAPYSPHLSTNFADFVPPISEGTGTLLTLVMLDAKTNIIKSLRAIGLGHDFSRTLYDDTQKLRSLPFDKNSYYSTVKRLMAQYTTDQLVDMAKNIYKL